VRGFFHCIARHDHRQRWRRTTQRKGLRTSHRGAAAARRGGQFRQSQSDRCGISQAQSAAAASVSASAPRTRSATSATPGEGERQAVATPLTEFPYYTIKELSKGPQVTSFVNVEFEGMDRYPGGGHITLTVWINEQGIVDSVTIERSNVPLKVEEHLRAAFLGAHFAPGEKDGNKVRSKMPVEVNYEPLNLVRPVTPLSTAKKR
jgi:hypothetical protein